MRTLAQPTLLTAYIRCVRPRVVILNGPSAVGKTTVGHALATLGRNAACVHGDQLRDFIVKRTAGEVDLGLGYRNGAAVVANFILAGYDLVVFDYVFEHPRHVKRFIDGCVADADFFLVTLWDTEEALLERDAGRAERESVGARAISSRDAIAKSLSHLGHVVEVEGRSPDELATEIDACTRLGKGRIAPESPMFG